MRSATPVARLPVARESLPANFLTVQALRVVAALLVVLLHAFETWGERVDPAAPGVNWDNGAAGVDIFFIISGFVMVISSRRLVDQAGAWLIFLRHRVVRIVPLYWLLTTVKILAVVALAGVVLRTGLDFNFVAGSYLFLPVTDSAGHFRPVLPVGWTLTYEFLFYLLFAAALAMRVDVLRVIIPGPGLIAITALARTEEFVRIWPDPDRAHDLRKRESTDLGDAGLYRRRGRRFTGTVCRARTAALAADLGRCIIFHLSQPWICATGIRHSGEQDCFRVAFRRADDHPLPDSQFDRGMDRFYLDRESNAACSQTR